MKNIALAALCLMLVASYAYGQERTTPEDTAMPAAPVAKPSAAVLELEDFLYLVKNYTAVKDTWGFRPDRAASLDPSILWNIPVNNIRVTDPKTPNITIPVFPSSPSGGINFWENLLFLYNIPEPNPRIPMENVVLFLDNSPDSKKYNSMAADVLRLGGRPGPYIGIWLRPSFFNDLLIQGYTGKFPPPKDLMAQWRDDNLREKNLRIQAEFNLRMLFIANEIFRFHYLVRDGLYTKIDHCLYDVNEQTDPSEVRDCAIMLWNLEEQSLRAYLEVSKNIEISYEHGTHMEHGNFTPAELDSFTCMDANASGTKCTYRNGANEALRNYLRFGLPRIYKEKAKLYKPYWDKKK